MDIVRNHSCYVPSSALFRIAVFLLQVLFVDYGTTSRMKKTDLRFMHQDFGEFPIQAIKASLVNIMPAGGAKKWPREVSVRFLELVSEKNLVAVISSVDHEVM
jgi:hypothetical protein